MRDLEQKITRTHEVRNGELIVIRRQEAKNGSNKDVLVITEEKGITAVDVDQVLNTEVPKEIVRIDKEESELNTKITELEEEIPTFSEDPEYKAFKEMIAKETTKKYFEQLNKEREIKVLKKQKEYLDEKRKDILDWKTQFEEIKKIIPETKEMVTEPSIEGTDVEKLMKDGDV